MYFIAASSSQLELSVIYMPGQSIRCARMTLNCEIKKVFTYSELGIAFRVNVKNDISKRMGLPQKHEGPDKLHKKQAIAQFLICPSPQNSHRCLI